MPLTSHLIASSRDPWPVSSTLLVAQALRHYCQYRQWPQPQIMQIPDQPDWGSLWQQIQGENPILLVVPGSLGDPISPGQTFADLAHDWQLPILLTLPQDPWLGSQVRAYGSLVREAGAVMRGVIGVMDEPDPLPPMGTTYSGIPWLGHLLLGYGDPTQTLHQAKEWDWEVLTDPGYSSANSSALSALGS